MTRAWRRGGLELARLRPWRLVDLVIVLVLLSRWVGDTGDSWVLRWPGAPATGRATRPRRRRGRGRAMWAAASDSRNATASAMSCVEATRPDGIGGRSASGLPAANSTPEWSCDSSRIISVSVGPEATKLIRTPRGTVSMARVRSVAHPRLRGHVGGLAHARHAGGDQADGAYRPGPGLDHHPGQGLRNEEGAREVDRQDAVEGCPVHPQGGAGREDAGDQGGAAHVGDGFRQRLDRGPVSDVMCRAATSMPRSQCSSCAKASTCSCRMSASTSRSAGCACASLYATSRPIPRAAPTTTVDPIKVSPSGNRYSLVKLPAHL